MSPTATVDFSVEERLRQARARYRLLADVFGLQAEAGLLTSHVRLSSDGCYALRDLCVECAEDLERLAQEMPPSMANWAPDDEKEPEPVPAVSTPRRESR